MGRDRSRVILLAAWLGSMLLLVFVAGVPFWLGLIGYVIGGLVIRRYAGTLVPGSLSGVERAMPIAAKGFLAVVALAGVLLLAVTLVAFLIAWLAN